MLDHTSVEQFHEVGDGATDLALSSFPLPNGPDVADAQNGSKLGLCKPEPLADGFELDGGHSEDQRAIGTPFVG